MTSNFKNKKELFKKIASFLKKRGVKSVKVFGSYARGEERPDSDIDILVEFKEAPSLLEFVRMERELSEEIGVKVDLVTKNALKPHIGKRILDEAVRI